MIRATFLFFSMILMLILSLLFSGGCAGKTESLPLLDEQVLPGEQDNPKTNLQKSLSVKDVEFSFVSLRTGKKVLVRVGYKVSFSAKDEPERRSTLERAMNFRKLEGTWLLIYLQHAAITYMNSGHTTVGVTIDVENNSGLVDGQPWWIPNTEGSEFGATTFTIRQGNSPPLVVIPGAVSREIDWRPFTYDSYAAWWKGVNATLRLETVFSATSD